jgi:hypothetical protein
VLAISYADPDAKTDEGKLATRLTFSEKVRALELQGRALGFLKGLGLRATEPVQIRVIHEQIK